MTIIKKFLMTINLNFLEKKTWIFPKTQHKQTIFNQSIDHSGGENVKIDLDWTKSNYIYSFSSSFFLFSIVNNKYIFFSFFLSFCKNKLPYGIIEFCRNFVKAINVDSLWIEYGYDSGNRIESNWEKCKHLIIQTTTTTKQQ